MPTKVPRQRSARAPNVVTRQGVSRTPLVKPVKTEVQSQQIRKELGTQGKRNIPTSIQTQVPLQRLTKTPTALLGKKQDRTQQKELSISSTLPQEKWWGVDPRGVKERLQRIPTAPNVPSNRKKSLETRVDNLSKRDIAKQITTDSDGTRWIPRPPDIPEYPLRESDVR